jgi:hypothetical protein
LGANYAAHYEGRLYSIASDGRCWDVANAVLHKAFGLYDSAAEDADVDFSPSCHRDVPMSCEFKGSVERPTAGDAPEDQLTSGARDCCSSLRSRTRACSQLLGQPGLLIGARWAVGRNSSALTARETMWAERSTFRMPTNQISKTSVCPLPQQTLLTTSQSTAAACLWAGRSAGPMGPMVCAGPSGRLGRIRTIVETLRAKKGGRKTFLAVRPGCRRRFRLRAASGTCRCPVNLQAA